MDPFFEAMSRGFDELLGRASGPLHLRLAIMPTVVTVLAVRAGLRDAREGRTRFVGAIFANPAERPRLLRSALKDLGRVLVMAVAVDTVYQVFVLRAFHVVQLCIVVVACAIVPYVLIRGPVCLLYTSPSPRD